jgi:tetratricopeptide (TPR) repeat protein
VKKQGCHSRLSHALHVDDFLRYHQNLNHLNRLLLVNIALRLVLLVVFLLPFSDALAQFPDTAVSNQPSIPAVAPTTSEHYTVSAKTLGISAKARKHLAAAHKEFSKMNVDEALRHIDATLHTDPGCAQAFSMRAFIRLAAKDPRGAVDDSRRAMALDPGDPEAYIALATSYNSLKEFQKAEEAVRQALRLRPEFWQGRLELAKSLYGQGEFVLALRELDSKPVNFPDAHLVRGNVLVRLGRSQEAGEEFHAFLQQDLSDPRAQQVHHIMGTLMLSHGNAPSTN